MPPRNMALACLLAAAVGALASPDETLFDDHASFAHLASYGYFLGAQRPGRSARHGYPDGQLHDRRHSFPLITGNGFRMLADFYIDDEGDIDVVGSKLLSTDPSSYLRTLRGSEAVVVFVDNMDDTLSTFLKRDIVQRSPRPVVLVVHNGDNDGIDPHHPVLRESNLEAVFTTNCVGSHPKVTCIPIGLENRQWPRHGSKPELIMGSFLASVGAPMVLDPAAGNATVTTACFSTNTNPAERTPLATMLTLEATRYAWVDTNCADYDVLSFYRKLSVHAAVVAPRGNGLDTHRAWESFYLGRLVVTRSSAMDRLWDDMPVLLLDDWADLSLHKVASAIRFQAARGARTKRVRTNKLYMQHWACLIGRAADRDREFCSNAALRATLLKPDGR